MVNCQIKTLRKKLNLTQKQLADLVHIDESMINKIERGHSTGSVRTLTKLATALGVSITELIAEQTPEPQEENNVLSTEQ
ncbi:MAG: transcriptional regulator [Gracilibacter sp. BRH_c7a]|nr:MAG: transcriptional regulator [Gracilibacter sp. BRH_c7a]